MPRIERFEDLESWKIGRQLRHTVYGYTRRADFCADHDLVSQIRRAAQSVTSNIAEGFERGGNREFIQFLSLSKGSIGEVKDQLYTALDEGYISQQDFDRSYDLAEQTTRLVGGFMSFLRRTDKIGSKFVSHSSLNPEP